MQRILLTLAILTSISQAQVSVDEFRARRAEIKSQLRPNERMIVLTNPTRNRNSDQNYVFRPDSDFWYVTGFHEPMAAIILSGSEISFKAGDQTFTGTEFLFLRENDPAMEVWNGHRVGIDRAPGLLGIDNALNIDLFAEATAQVLAHADTAYLNMSWGRTTLPLDVLAGAALTYLPRERSDFRKGPLGLLQKAWGKLAGLKKKFGKNRKLGYKNAGEIIHPMRLVKSEGEMVFQQRTIDITGESHVAAMKRAKPGLYEYQLQATIEAIYRENGSMRVGFPSIVASGPNALTLHYEENDRMMNDGELILIDIGAEYGMFSADVTRTIPVNGRFTDEQREIYNYVLEAQSLAAAAIKPGVTRRDLHKIAKEYLDSTGFGEYFIHGLSHWLGMDVHDVGGRTPIIAGSVFTIEPGIYIPADAEGVDPKYRGIGVRIEDDYMATEDGYVKLSRAIPSTVEAIEETMGSRN